MDLPEADLRGRERVACGDCMRRLHADRRTCLQVDNLVVRELVEGLVLIENLEGGTQGEREGEKRRQMRSQKRQRGDGEKETERGQEEEGSEKRREKRRGRV